MMDAENWLSILKASIDNRMAQDTRFQVNSSNEILYFEFRSADTVHGFVYVDL